MPVGQVIPKRFRTGCRRTLLVSLFLQACALCLVPLTGRLIACRLGVRQRVDDARAGLEAFAQAAIHVGRTGVEPGQKTEEGDGELRVFHRQQYKAAPNFTGSRMLRWTASPLGRQNPSRFLPAPSHDPNHDAARRPRR